MGRNLTRSLQHIAFIVFYCHLPTDCRFVVPLADHHTRASEGPGQGARGGGAGGRSARPCRPICPFGRWTFTSAAAPVPAGNSWHFIFCPDALGDTTCSVVVKFGDTTPCVTAGDVVCVGSGVAGSWRTALSTTPAPMNVRLAVSDLAWLREMSERTRLPPSELVRASLRMFRSAAESDATLIGRLETAPMA